MFYQSFKFTEEKFDNNLIKNLKESDYILVSIAPINNKDIVIENFKQELITKNYKWITYLSATSVYGIIMENGWMKKVKLNQHQLMEYKG